MYHHKSFGALITLPSVLAVLFPERIINDPTSEYLFAMCRPDLVNATKHLSANAVIPSLANSLFPCDQVLYFESSCAANGTTEIDFLAEQECFCNGAFWEVVAGCDACYQAHGYLPKPSSEIFSARSSLSSAECNPTPPYQPFSNLLPAVNITSARLAPPLTLGDDKFPNNTAISNYFTTTQSVTRGEITGSATARLTSWTNYNGIRFTPTSTPSISATGVSVSPTSTRVSSSTSDNIAATSGIEVMGGLLAAGIGALLIL